MLRIAVVTCLLLLLPLAGAAAGSDEDLSSGEKRFLKSLLNGLGDDSPKVRAAAEEALVFMDAKAASYLVGEAGRLKSRVRESVVRVLVRIGQPSLDAIKRLEDEPKGRAKEVFEFVEAELVGAGGIGGYGQPDAETAARVREVMDQLPKGSFSSDEPLLEELIVLGTPAIPVLLDYLNPSRPHDFTMSNLAAVAALTEICDKSDTQRLCRLLDQGWIEVASVLEKLEDDACIPTLIRMMEKGQMGWELGSAIKSYRSQALYSAVVRFLDEHGTCFPYGTRHLLELVSREKLTEALPAVQKMAKVKGRNDPNLPSNRVEVGRTLALLGDRNGIPILIRWLVTRDHHDEWVTRTAGEALNALTGLSIWNKGGEPRKIQAAYQSWWDANRDRLQFDPMMRRYEVR